MTLQTQCTIESETVKERISIPQPTSHYDEVSLIEVFTQLAYRKQMLAKITGAAILLGLALAFASARAVYRNYQVMPPQQTQSTASIMMSQLSAAGGWLPGRTCGW